MRTKHKVWVGGYQVSWWSDKTKVIPNSTQFKFKLKLKLELSLAIWIFPAEHF